MKKNHSAWIFGVGSFIVFAAIALVIFAVTCIPTGRDHERVNLLLRDIEQHYKFTTMREDGHGSAVYCTGLAYSDHIHVYGVYTEQEVNEILKVAKDAQDRRADKKPITIRFCSKELDDSSLYKEVTIKR